MQLNTDNIPRYLQTGAHDINWYQDCAKIFIDLFGEDRLPLVCKLFAATSINTSLKANVYLFRKALYEIENDLPIGNYLPNIQKQLRQIREGGELTGQKIRAFEAAMRGDPHAVVVDTWLLRAFDVERQYVRKEGKDKDRGRLRSAGASEKEFKAIEAWIRQYAQDNGYQARQISAIIWSGIRIERTGKRDTHYRTTLYNALHNLFSCI